MVRRWEEASEWKCFKGLKNPVKAIWIDGNINKEDLENSAAVVGSRRISQYGRQAADRLAVQLVRSDKTVISGFMYGTDQAVHRSVLENGGKTVAVLGWGIKYEKVEEEDRKLWKKIVETGGAIISEWEYQTPAYWTFPARDRIMAALASDIYVVEAAEKSGSLITAQMAMELHKNVWAVPGSVFSSVSAGTNRLISEGKAKMWLPAQQMNFNLGSESLGYTNNTDIYTKLQNEILTADEIAKATDRPIAEVLQELMMLTLQGKVVEKEGKYLVVV